MTFMSRPAARRATSRPTRPRPTTPSVLPASWVPTSLARSHLPACRLASAAGMWRARAIKSVMVCSAVLTVLPPGVFMTTMPLRVAAATSMLSTPTPARTMARSLPGFSRSWAVTRVPERTIMPAAACSASKSAASFRPGRLWMSSPEALSRSMPPVSSLSLMKMRGIVRGPWSVVRGPRRFFSHGLRTTDYGLFVSKHPLRRRQPLAQLDEMPHLGERQLDAGDCGENVELIDVAHVGQADDLALEAVLPVGKLEAKLLFELGQQRRRIDVRRHLDDRERGVRLLGEQLQAERLKTGAGGLGVACLPLPDVLDPLREDLLQADTHRPDHRVRRRVRRVGRLQVLLRLLQVEVERARIRIALDRLPGLVADRKKRQPRRHHQRLLRAGAVDVDVPIIRPALHCAQAADGIDQEQRRRLGDDAAERGDVVADAGRGLAQGRADGGRVGMIGERLFELGRLDRVAVG